MKTPTKLSMKSVFRPSVIAAAVMLSVLFLLSACQTSDTLSSAAAEAGRQAFSGPLPAQKDGLFSYRTPLEVRDGGSFLRVPYDEQRDINDRDEMPVRKVRSSYTERLPASDIADLTYESENGSFAVYRAGRAGGNSASVVYIHGKGGNREWGFDDERFGGNFNRLKNLVSKGGGAYFSPDFSDFGERGVADISALVERISRESTAPVVIACGSLGNAICWGLANNAASLQRISGFVILSGFPDRDFLRVAFSGAFAPRPVYIAHGSRDKVYPVEDMLDFYQALEARDYPARMTVFDTGNHGTPIRMIDWRQALNWILSFRR